MHGPVQAESNGEDLLAKMNACFVRAVDVLQKSKDDAYEQILMLVLILSRIAYENGMGAWRQVDPSPDCEPEYKSWVCIQVQDEVIAWPVPTEYDSVISYLPVRSLDLKIEDHQTNLTAVLSRVLRNGLTNGAECLDVLFPDAHAPRPGQGVQPPV